MGNEREDYSAVPAGLSVFLVALGTCLVLAGVAFLVYVLQLIFAILQEPTSVPLVDYVLSKITDSQNAVTIVMKEADKTVEYSISWSASMHSLIVAMISILASGLVVRTCVSFITAGAMVLKYALPEKTKKRSVVHYGGNSQ